MNLTSIEHLADTEACLPEEETEQLNAGEQVEVEQQDEEQDKLMVYITDSPHICGSWAESCVVTGTCSGSLGRSCIECRDQGRTQKLT